MQSPPQNDPYVEIKTMGDGSSPPRAVAAADTIRADFAFYGVALDEALYSLSEIYHVNFVNHSAAPPPVYAAVKQLAIEPALEALLTPLGLTFLKQGATIDIYPKDASAVCIYKIENHRAFELASVLKATNEELKAIADTVTNSILVDATVGEQRQFAKTIATLDRRKPAVLIEVEIIETNLDVTEEAGLSWRGNYQKGDRTVDFRSPTESIKSLIHLRQAGSLTIDAFVDGVLSKTRGRLLSKPRIVTLDGQMAQILVGERVPYTERTAATEGGVVVQSVSFLQVGIRLDVTPILYTTSDRVRIKVHPEVSEVLDKAVQGVPRIGTREATTEILTSNHQTVVIGGLIRENKTTTRVYLPILGRIFPFNHLPISTFDEWRRTELIVFITPHILS